MTEKILVTYASRTGSTAGVAAAIAKTLQGEAPRAARVDLLPMLDVHDVAPYHAVVAGSAIRHGAWLPEAMHFIRRFQPQLVQRPFAAFLVCMTLAMRDAERYRPAVADWLAPVRAYVRPVSEGLFAGTLRIDKVPSLRDRLKFRLSIAAGAWTEGDHRDWEAIHAWAQQLEPLLTVPHHPATP